MRPPFLLCLISIVLSCYLHGKNNCFIIGRDPAWTPLNFDEKTLDVTQFSSKIVEGINYTEKSDLEVRDMSSSALFTALENGDVDGILTPLEQNRETLAKYNFSTPFFMAGPVLVVQTNSSIKKLSDLKNRRLGISSDCHASSSVHITTYESPGEVLYELSKGTLDAALIPTTSAHALISTLYKEELKIVTAPLDQTSLKLVTLKNQKRDLLMIFNRGLKHIKKIGLYRLLRLEYNVN